MKTHRLLKAIIFDFDGVLADSEPLHFRGFQMVLREESIHLSEREYARHYVGLTDAECFSAVFRDCQRRLETSDLKRLIGKKSTWMLAAMQSQEVLIPGMAHLVNRMARHYRLAVASCALREEVTFGLRRADLLDAFEVIVAAEDVRVGKPDPAVYLAALTQLQSTAPLTAAECLAIEDTPLGICAAQGAGLKCLAVATTLPPDALSIADAVVPSLVTCDVSGVVNQLYGKEDVEFNASVRRC